jgi:hypothetical protein
MLNQNYLTSICYIIIVNDDYDATFFNKYDKFLVENVGVIHAICTLPKSMDELFFQKEEMISARLSGIFDGYKVRFCSSVAAARELPYEFKIAFVSDEADRYKITRALFLSNAQKNAKDYRSVGLEDLTLTSVKEHFLEISKELSPDKAAYISELETVLDKEPTGTFIDTDYEFEKSIYNLASLGVLSSLRVAYSFEDNRMQWDEDRALAPLELLSQVRKNIFRHVPPPTFLPHTSLVLTDMSSDLNPLVFKQHYTQNYLKNDGHADPRLLIQALSLVNRNTIAEGLGSNAMVLQFYKERLLIEAMISLYAASYASHCIKIPLANKAVFGILKNIGIIDRGRARGKIDNQVLAFTNELEKLLKTPLDLLPNAFTSAVKIVSNLPVEWAHHDGLPLMVRHEVSRIPISPGVPAAMCLLDGEQIHLGIEDLKKIRVISSFDEDDHLKNLLTEKIDLVMQPLADKKKYLAKKAADLGASLDLENATPFDFDINWYKVGSAEEFLLSLSDNDSAITIFNMHGGHSPEGIGTLAVGNDKVSIYDMIGKFQASPIVILCSCDTSPIDRNHYSTATAFQLAGAKTVLASALPILADEASTFIARLLLRIRFYLPRRLSSDDGRSIRWSSFVAGMIRRSFYSELFELMAKKFKLTPDVKRALNYFSGTRLDPLHENWHEDIMQYTCTETGIDIEVIEQFIKDSFALPECLKYIQMGNPESIILVSENHIPVTK